MNVECRTRNFECRTNSILDFGMRILDREGPVNVEPNEPNELNKPPKFVVALMVPG